MKNHARTLLTIMCASLGVSAPAALTLTNYQAMVKAQAPGFYFTFDSNALANVLTGSPALTPLNSVASQFSYDIFQDPNDCIYFTVAGDAAYDLSESSDHIVSGGGVATSTSTAAGAITLLFRNIRSWPAFRRDHRPGRQMHLLGGRRGRKLKRADSAN